MPRLRFAPKPIDRNESHWQSREDHDAWVRQVWTNYGREGEPTPCDCGFWGDDWLATCDDQDRRRCKVNVEKRLERHYRQEHEAALALKRKFPEQPHPGRGMCRWCRQPIVHGRVNQRSSHDGRRNEPDCKLAYLLHTDLHVQRNHLVSRDGQGCTCCGKIEGRWQGVWLCQESCAEEYGFDGENWRVRWVTQFEVDHFIPLAAAYPCFPNNDRRRWFFSPANLQLLCSDCHKAKTQRDRALIRQIAVEGPGWGLAEINKLLAASGRALPPPRRPGRSF